MALTNKKTKGSRTPNMDAAAEEIKKIIEKRNAELSAVSKLIEEAKTETAEAEKALDAAVLSGDTAAYSAAKTAYRTAQDAEEMHTKRAQALRSVPLISEDKRAELAKAIKGDVAIIVNSNTAELLKTGAALYEMHNEEHAAILRCNELLERLQREIMHTPSNVQTDAYHGPEIWKKLWNGVLRGNADIFGEPPTE